MSSVVWGIGVGIILLLTIWITAILIVIVSLRTRQKLGPFALAFAGLITCLLLVIPLDSEKPVVQVERVDDELFIWRTCLLVILTASSGVGLFSYILHCMEPQLARPAK